MAECWSAGWDMWVCPLNTKHNLVCLLTLSPLYCWITSPTSQQITVQSLNLPQEGCYMHKKSTGKVSSAFLTERLYGTDRQNSYSCPRQAGDPGRMAYIKIYGLRGPSDPLCVVFSFSKNNYFCFFVLSWQVNVLFQDPGEVHGSLSVLLDSALCAISPLLFLTSQVPEMNGCSAKTQVLGFFYFNQHLVSPDGDSA